MKSRAGTIFRKEDSASHKKRGTIFIDGKKQNKQMNVIHADEARAVDRELEYEDKKGTPPPKLDSHDLKTDTPPVTGDGRKSPAIELTDPPRTLEEISKTAARVVYRIKTVFPFVLFPDEVIADEEKVTIVIGSFFKSGYLRSVMLQDISTVSVDTDIFFATLTIIDRNYIQDAMVIRFLKKEEGFKMRRVLMGLIIANQNKVDMSAYSVDELREYTEKIGGSKSQVPSSI